MNKENIKNIFHALWDDIVILTISFVAGYLLGRCFNLFGEESVKVFITAIAIYGAYTLTKPTKEDNTNFITKSIIYVIVIQLIYAFVIGNPVAKEIITQLFRTTVSGLFIFFAIFFIAFWFFNRKKSLTDDDEDIEDKKENHDDSTKRLIFVIIFIIVLIIIFFLLS